MERCLMPLSCSWPFCLCILDDAHAGQKPRAGAKTDPSPLPIRPENGNGRPWSTLLILEAIQKSGLALKPILVLQPSIPQEGVRFASDLPCRWKDQRQSFLEEAKRKTPGNSRKPVNRPLKVHNPKGGL